MNKNEYSDILIYVDSLIEECEKEGLFDDSDKTFMDYDVFYGVILDKVKINYLKDEDIELTEEQLVESINETVKIVIQQTFDSLYDKGLLDLGNMDVNGDFGYILNKQGEEVLKKLNKK